MDSIPTSREKNIIALGNKFTRNYEQIGSNLTLECACLNELMRFKPPVEYDT